MPTCGHNCALIHRLVHQPEMLYHFSLTWGEIEALAADDGSQFVERRRWPRVSQAPLGEGLTASPALVPLRFETSSLPTDQQFAAWQAHMSVLLTTHLPE
ncbi:AraC family transcriptional regulator, partial [Brucella abortus]